MLDPELPQCPLAAGRAGNSFHILLGALFNPSFQALLPQAPLHSHFALTRLSGSPSPPMLGTEPLLVPVPHGDKVVWGGRGEQPQVLHGHMLPLLVGQPFPGESQAVTRGFKPLGLWALPSAKPCPLTTGQGDSDLCQPADE